MYYLIKCNDNFVIRSFPHDKCSMWAETIEEAFCLNRGMKTHTNIVEATIEAYAERYGDTFTVLATWDTPPTLEQAQLDYPELFI